MGQIATKAYCNTLKPGAFSGGDLNQCPTKSQIESAGLTIIGGTYESNQLVQQEHIGSRRWEYTFKVSPSSLTIPNSGGSDTFTVTSYKTQYQTSSTGDNEQIAQEAVDFTVSNSGSGDVSKGSTSGFNTTVTVSMDVNNSSESRNGTVRVQQNESSDTETVSYSQSSGTVTVGPVVANFSPSNIVVSPAGGTISGSGIRSTGGTTNVTITYSQTWGWNGSSSGGGVYTTGATISWTSVSIPSLGTGSGGGDTGRTVTATVRLNGKEDTVTIPIYYGQNQETDRTTEWSGEVEWNQIVLQASPSVIDMDGGTSTITNTVTSGTTNTGTESGTIIITYPGGQDRQPTSRTVTENINFTLQSSVEGFSISRNVVTAQKSSVEERSVVVVGTGEKSGSSKSGTVKVTQKGGVTSYTYTFTVSTTSVNIPSSGGSGSFTVTSYREGTRGGSSTGKEAVPWSISGGSTFTVDPKSGTGGTSSQSVKVTKSTVNNTASDIKETITVTQGGGSDQSPKQVNITQSGVTSWTYSISVTPDSAEWTYSQSGSGSGKNFTVKCTRTGGGITEDVDWTISSNSASSWLTANKSGNTLTCYPSSTNSGNARSGTITVAPAASSSTTDTISVSQTANVRKQYQYKFSVSPSSLNFSNTEGSQDLNVTSQRREITITGSSVTNEGSYSNWSTWDGSITQGQSYFTKTDKSRITASNNSTTSTRSGTYVLTQTQTDKCTMSGYNSDSNTINVPLKQNGVSVTWGGFPTFSSFRNTSENNHTFWNDGQITIGLSPGEWEINHDYNLSQYCAVIYYQYLDGVVNKNKWVWGPNFKISGTISPSNPSNVLPPDSNASDYQLMREGNNFITVNAVSKNSSIITDNYSAFYKVHQLRFRFRTLSNFSVANTYNQHLAYSSNIFRIPCSIVIDGTNQTVAELINKKYPSDSIAPNQIRTVQQYFTVLFRKPSN